MTAVIVETDRQGAVSVPSIESLAIAQELGGPVTALVTGAETARAATALAAFDLSDIVAVDDPPIEPGASTTLVSTLAAWIDAAQPELVIAPHSYSARDYLPRLAARLDRPLITDCLGVRIDNGARVFTRPLFQGKLVADVVLDGPSPHFATFQAGATRADSARPATVAPRVTRRSPTIGPDATQVGVEPPFHDTSRTIDLTQADRIVAVGRGLNDGKHLAMIQELATALGAEVAASRPVCDLGWLPLDRQVGSSGQTVAPALYVAIGISGAIQHIVGMKSAKTIVAINKDRDAPIFEIADYGVVGDLFEIVPALIAALKGGHSGNT
jgi:electron transfer flavoprotein alpha subunit